MFHESESHFYEDEACERSDGLIDDHDTLIVSSFYALQAKDLVKVNKISMAYFAYAGALKADSYLKAVQAGFYFMHKGTQ